MTSTLETPPKKSVTRMSSGLALESSVEIPGCEWIRAGSYVSN